MTISLADKTKELIEQLARDLTTSEYVRRAIFRQIWQDAAAESQRIALPQAQAGHLH